MRIIQLRDYLDALIASGVDRNTPVYIYEDEGDGGDCALPKNGSFAMESAVYGILQQKLETLRKGIEEMFMKVMAQV